MSKTWQVLVLILWALWGSAGCTSVVPPHSLVLQPSRDLDSFLPNSDSENDRRTGFKIENYDEHSTKTVTAQLEELGLESPKIYALTPTYSKKNRSLDLRLPPMTFLVFREGGWDTSALLQTVHDVPARFATCGIALSEVLVIETRLSEKNSGLVKGLGFDVLEIDHYHKVSEMINRLPIQRRPLFFFVGSIYSASLNESVGGFAVNVLNEFDIPAQPSAEHHTSISKTGGIARRPMENVKNYEFDQSVSHEMGHMLGLRHVHHSNKEANIMEPLTCTDCEFTASQCRTMRHSSLLKQI